MQDSDNPFGAGDADKTVLRPSPGGRQRAGKTPVPESGRAGVGTRGANPLNSDEISTAWQGADRNPLLSAATTLFALASELGNTLQQDYPEELFDEVVRLLQRFERCARGSSVPAEAVLAARYTLCTFLDEVVLGTPWGGRSIWAEKTLLNTFHQEGWGGEKVFHLIDRAKPDPARNIELLELFYVCLSLGFEGKYRLNERGRGTLDAIRSELYQLIRLQRGEHEPALSPHWQGVEDQRSKLVRYVPFWLLGLIAAGISLLAYSGLLYSLNSQSDPVMVELASLGKHTPAMDHLRPQPPVDVVIPPAAVERAAGLRELLAAPVEEGLLDILDVRGGAKVILHGDGLFSSGSARINATREPLLGQVAKALSALPGQVLITGHTDNIPIRTLRFPSNWHLSKARAESVKAAIAERVSANRLTAEPRADNEPLVDNDSAANRARNRRVEIILFSG